MKHELKTTFGKTYLTIEFDAAHGWIYNNWLGVIPSDTVVLGATQVLEVMRETGCHYILNDNRSVVGSWDQANDWIEQQWMPQALRLGLRRFAHVLSPGVFGRVSGEEMLRRVGDRFEMHLFDDVTAAQRWLREAQHQHTLVPGSATTV
ncbi:hypothetical protein F0P96_04145 [Hymenobacter busanensis]|uniref:Uncharacterized protein n=1 Tax=Hymenobacter busanensis TaxID=2607656 RepID=A0A7L4ZTI1_9BACT|nr:hypothetical protein [Hymenobacter busanensis]KAA9339816.1 hypothetical protein F0P96_04145 [Hymenobacter busanensis]QHJ06431.1 hypothetical protein GUY19_03600 [Hymenobacter busanensis]